MPAIASSGSGEPPLPPDYVDYNNASGIRTIVGFVTALALLTVLLRLYVRAIMLKVVGIDDYLMILAMLLSTIVLVCFVEETHYGLGKHFIVAISNPVAWEKVNIWTWAHSIIIVMSNSTLKISVAFFLMRITARTHYHRFLWGVIVFIVLFTIACVGTLLFQCIPVSAAWNYSLRPPPFGRGSANCFSPITFRDIGVFNSCVIMGTDVLFASLPVPLIWSLQLNTRQKLSLIFTLSLGFFSCAASLVKTVLQYNFLQNPDWTTHDSFAVWFAIEVNVGIIAASLPALKPLLTWRFDVAKRALPGASGHSDLASRSSSRRSRKTLSLSLFKGRLGNGRSASSLGYLKQAKDKNIPMDTLGSETARGNHTHHFSEDTKGDLEVNVTSGEFMSDAGIGTALTSDSKRENSIGVTWTNDTARSSYDSILPLQGRPPNEKGRIVKTTEVTLG